ncbi:MAG: anhydro-N-acetylmuramic acid kinase [Flammeovirgaceae bacterium]
MINRKYNVVGVMSGTSCDGLDIALCSFWYSNKKWKYELVDSKEIIYQKELQRKLIECSSLNGYDLKVLDIELGVFIGKEILKFIHNSNIKIDLISSHGHTVFHNPIKKIHHQIGNPFQIFKKTNYPVVYNFRELDVILGGQGAPLVPYGDKNLFGEYDYCVNIGGILNLTSLKSKLLHGYDICPANIILNYYSKKLNYEMDINGELSKKGKLNNELFNSLNELPYYKKNYPKSLDLIYIRKNYFPLLQKLKSEDVLHTFVDHIAYQLNNNIENKNARVLLSGGGSLNTHLIEKLNYFNKQDVKFIVPNKKLVIFKEAIVFGFLGLLRFLNKKNIDKEVTGSSNSTSSGLIVNNKIF